MTHVGLLNVQLFLAIDQTVKANEGFAGDFTLLHAM
jgi:hypothetical protein